MILVSPQQKWVHSKRMMLLKLYGSKCFLCHEELDGDFHFVHIRPTTRKGRSRGSYHRMNDVREHLDCYRPMHEDCHKTFDTLEAELFCFDPYST